jgi:hypothetical protein
MRQALVLAAAGLLSAGVGAGALAAQDDGERYGYVGTSLFGDQEVDTKGAGGDAGADFVAEFDYQEGRMCYRLELTELDGFTEAHIHKGDVGKNGPPVVELKLSDDDNDVCQAAEVELMKDIEANRADYYVNVHTTKHPSGAVRGQLGQD